MLFYKASQRTSFQDRLAGDDRGRYIALGDAPQGEQLASQAEFNLSQITSAIASAPAPIATRRAKLSTFEAELMEAWVRP